MSDSLLMPWRTKIILILVSVSIIAAHAALFGRYLPNESGLLGHDYSYFLPHLLDGYYWSHENGFLSPPWMTPGFCGGLPKFGNPQALYFSVPQLLTTFMDPLTAVRMTLLLFAAAGYIGFYLLLRRVFLLSSESSVLGATLFLFNGLFASRMWIGHLTFHSFMLVPLLALALHERPRRNDRTPQNLETRCFKMTCAALIIAYMAVTGLPHVLFQAIAITIALSFLSRLSREDAPPWHWFVARLAVAGLFAMGISAAKLIAVASYLGQFPRTLYPLPGIDSMAKLVMIAATSLFGTPRLDWVTESAVNAHWGNSPHEFDFGLTPIPIAILLVSIIMRFSLRGIKDWWMVPDAGRRGCVFALALLLTAPVAMNYYQPGWNAMLKQIPILASSSNLFRWFSVYIPVVCVLASMALDREELFLRHRKWIAAAAVLVVIVMNGTRDRSYYEAQTFDPNPVLEAYRDVQSGSGSPGVDRIAVSRDLNGEEILAKHRNISLADGASQLLCYENLFGYQLERFPRGALREGNIMQPRNGVLNLKNPACFIYPEENECRPGDHFAMADSADATAFAAYRPYPFNISRAQRIGNITSLAAISSLALLQIVLAFRFFKSTRRRANRSSTSD